MTRVGSWRNRQEAGHEGLFKLCCSEFFYYLFIQIVSPKEF